MNFIVRLVILPVILLCSSLSLASASPDRVALVIGMADYETITPLTNTRNDAEALADTLTEIGFDVTRVIDVSLDELRAVMKDFSFRSETADLALIYFAGHGIEVQGENFLIPIDAQPRSNLDVQNQSVSLKEMLAVVEKARVMRIVILDSCRDNPLGGSIDTNAVVQSALQSTEQATRGVGGLAPANPDRGTLVAFAAKDGQVALDGTRGNSPYARALMEKDVEAGAGDQPDVPSGARCGSGRNPESPGALYLRVFDRAALLPVQAAPKTHPMSLRQSLRNRGPNCVRIRNPNCWRWPIWGTHGRCWGSPISASIPTTADLTRRRPSAFWNARSSGARPRLRWSWQNSTSRGLVSRWTKRARLNSIRRLPIRALPMQSTILASCITKEGLVCARTHRRLSSCSSVQPTCGTPRRNSISRL